VDQRIRQFVKQQVADGILNVAEVQRHTEAFVKRQLFDDKHPPSKLNRRYFPHRRDFQNLIYRARIAGMKSLVDQENLALKIKEWESDSDVKLFFRPYVDCETAEDSTQADDSDDDDVAVVRRGAAAGLLFIHQTEWQRRLLRRYGSLCLMDATYKTTRYALPLFFVCVRTNVDYVVVATFVTQHEDSGSIAEALEILRSWCDGWTPESFMVDFSEPEVQALEAVFPGKL